VSINRNLSRFLSRYRLPSLVSCFYLSSINYKTSGWRGIFIKPLFLLLIVLSTLYDNNPESNINLIISSQKVFYFLPWVLIIHPWLLHYWRVFFQWVYYYILRTLVVSRRLKTSLMILYNICWLSDNVVTWPERKSSLNWVISRFCDVLCIALHRTFTNKSKYSIDPIKISLKASYFESKRISFLVIHYSLSWTSRLETWFSFSQTFPRVI